MLFVAASAASVMKAVESTLRNRKEPRTAELFRPIRLMAGLSSETEALMASGGLGQCGGLIIPLVKDSGQAERICRVSVLNFCCQAIALINSPGSGVVLLPPLYTIPSMT
jgi:hypothetical protein